MHVVAGVHQALRPPERSHQEHRVRQVDLTHPLDQPLPPLQVQHRAAPRFAVELEEPPRSDRRLPEQVVHVEVRPLPRPKPRTHLVEIRGPGQRREDGESRLKQLEAFDECPQPFEIRLAPGGVDHEISRDAVFVRATSTPRRRLGDGGVFADGRAWSSPLRAEEDVEVFGNGRYARAVPDGGDEVARLGEDPCFRTAPPQLLRERDSATDDARISSATNT